MSENTSYPAPMDDVKIYADISKIDDEKRQVFGWASVTELDGEPVVDLQNDVMETLDLEKAAYNYVLSSRVGGAMHQRVEKSKPKKVAELIESMMLTPEKISKMGLPDTTPHGWWIGFQIGRDETGDKVWDAVKKGKYTGFSIHGLGRRVEKSIDEINKSIAEIKIPQYTKRDGTVVEAHTRQVDTGQALAGGINVGLSGAASGIATAQLRAGHKGAAAAYGAYALLSLFDAIRSANKAVKPTPDSENEPALLMSLLEAASLGLGVSKSQDDEVTEDQFDDAVETLAAHVGVDSEEFLERLGEYTMGMGSFAMKDLENFLESFEVQKHLIGRHEQKDHDPNKKGHARSEHKGVLRQEDQERTKARRDKAIGEKVTELLRAEADDLGLKGRTAERYVQQGGAPSSSEERADWENRLKLADRRAEKERVDERRAMVGKHLIGRHEQEDHDPNKKKRDHSRSDHKNVELKPQWQGTLGEPKSPSENAALGALMFGLLGAASSGGGRTGLIASALGGAGGGAVTGYQAAGGQIYGNPEGSKVGGIAAGAANATVDPVGTGIRRLLYGDPNEQKLSKSLEGKMATRLEFLVEKAKENSDSEDELLDNLADLADGVEKMLVAKTDKEEVSKETVIVEQYTRQDGTVVPRHEREISGRAAAALAGAAGIGLLASPLGRGVRSAAAMRAGGVGQGLQRFGSNAQSAAQGAAQGARGFAQNLGQGIQRFGANAQMQAGTASQGVQRGARTGNANFHAGRMFGGEGGLGARTAMETARVSPSLGAGIAAGATGRSVRQGASAVGSSRAGQGAAEFGRGGRDVLRRPNQFANNITGIGNPNTTAAYAAGGGAAAGGLYGGAVGGALHGVQRLRERRETRKSLTEDEKQVLEKYLGRNLDE